MWLILHQARCRKLTTNHYGRDLRDVSQTWVQSDSVHEASQLPRIDSPWTLASLSERKSLLFWFDCLVAEKVVGRCQTREIIFLLWPWRISGLLSLYSNQWNIASRTKISDVSLAHLCGSTSTNRSWSRRKQKLYMPGVDKEKLGKDYGEHSYALQAC